MHEPQFPSIATQLEEIQALINRGKHCGRRRKRKATEHFRQALTLSRSLYGKDHPTTLACLGFLSDNLRERGEIQEALELAHDGFLNSTDKEGYWTAATIPHISRAAKCYEALRQYQNAAGLWGMVAAQSYGEAGYLHLNTLYPLHRQGLCLQRAGKPEEALPILYNAYSKLSLLYGLHDLAIYAAVDLARTYEQVHNWDEAIMTWSEALIIATTNRVQHLVPMLTSACRRLEAKIS